MWILQQFVRHFSMSSRRPSPKYWREAATLIVAAPKTTGVPTAEPKKDPYNILMLKRGAESPFAPNRFVYPGGCVTEEDFDKKTWKDIYEKTTNIDIDTIDNAFRIPGHQIDMLKRKIEWTESLSPDVAFRICALRETFEESGLLFVSHKSNFSGTPELERSKYSRSFPRRHVPQMYKMPEDFDTDAWRKRVSSNASAFRDLCTSYNVVPNIWALYEWCSWLTPAVEKVDKPPPKPKRFDTIFYLCFLETHPEGAVACSDETTEAEWRLPQVWMNQSQSGEVKMFGPQVYESDRLSFFRNIAELSDYAQQREPLGLIRFLPIIVMCEDDASLVLPGDDMYPENPDAEGKKDPVMTVHQSLSDFLSAKGKLHRADRRERLYSCNIELPYGLSTNSGSPGNPGANPWHALARALNNKL